MLRVRMVDLLTCSEHRFAHNEHHIVTCLLRKQTICWIRETIPLKEEIIVLLLFFLFSSIQELSKIIKKYYSVLLRGISFRINIPIVKTSISEGNKLLLLHYFTKKN